MVAGHKSVRIRVLAAAFNHHGLVAWGEVLVEVHLGAQFVDGAERLAAVGAIQHAHGEMLRAELHDAVKLDVGIVHGKDACAARSSLAHDKGGRRRCAPQRHAQAGEQQHRHAVAKALHS